MTREEILTLIRSHLVEELMVEPDRIQAAKILTVGQAVDFVLASGVAHGEAGR